MKEEQKQKKDWKTISTEERVARSITFGKITVELEEADIRGEKEFATLHKSRNDTDWVKGEPPSSPSVETRQMIIKGVPATGDFYSSR